MVQRYIKPKFIKPTEATMKKSNSTSSMSSNDFVTTDRFFYQDRSRLPDDGSYKMPDFSRLSLAAARVQKLPPKLYTILSMREFSRIITWMPHGRSWKVIDTKGFQEEVMPRFFEYTNYESFVRLVNAWGFKRVPLGPDRSSYFHEMFLRGVPHLLGKMHRLTNKDKRIKVRREDQLNLYNLSERYPLPAVSNTGCSSSSTDSIEQRSEDSSGLRLLSTVTDEVSVNSDLSQESFLSKTLRAQAPCQDAKPPVMLSQCPGRVIGAPLHNTHENAMQFVPSLLLNTNQQMQQWSAQTNRLNAMQMRVTQLEQELAMYRAQMRVSQLEKELAIYRSICGNVSANFAKEGSVD